MSIVYLSTLNRGHSKIRTLRDGGGGALKAYENVKGEGGGRGKAYGRYKKLLTVLVISALISA